MDVLTVDLRVLAWVDDGTEAVVATIETLGKTGHLDEGDGIKDMERFVAIWMITCRFWRMLTLSISFVQVIDCSVARPLK